MRLVIAAQMPASGASGIAEDQSRREDHRAVEQRHGDRAGEVAGDRAVDDAADVVGAVRAHRRHEAAAATHERVAVEQHRDRGDEHEQRGAQAAEEPVANSLIVSVSKLPGRSSTKSSTRPTASHSSRRGTDHRPAVELLDRRRAARRRTSRPDRPLSDRAASTTPPNTTVSTIAMTSVGDGPAALQPFAEEADDRVEGEAEQDPEHQWRQRPLRRPYQTRARRAPTGCLRRSSTSS